MFANVPAARPSLRATALSKVSCASTLRRIEPPEIANGSRSLLRTKSRRSAGTQQTFDVPRSLQGGQLVRYGNLVASGKGKVGRNRPSVRRWWPAPFQKKTAQQFS